MLLESLDTQLRSDTGELFAWTKADRYLDEYISCVFRYCTNTQTSDPDAKQFRVSGQVAYGCSGSTERWSCKAVDSGSDQAPSARGGCSWTKASNAAHETKCQPYEETSFLRLTLPLHFPCAWPAASVSIMRYGNTNTVRNAIWWHISFSFLQVGSKYILFGGADMHHRHFEDIYCFDTAGGQWEKVSFGEIRGRKKPPWVKRYYPKKTASRS